TLWNRTRQRAEAVGVGKVASTPAEAVADAEVVISMLTDADALRATYLGADGAVKAARRQVFVEMSTAGPDVAKELAPVIEATGAQFVEAPVLGSTAPSSRAPSSCSRQAKRPRSSARLPSSRRAGR